MKKDGSSYHRDDGAGGGVEIMIDLSDKIEATIRTATDNEPRRLYTTIRMASLSLLATLLLTVPVSAQVSSAEEARNVEGVGVLEGIVYFLMGVVPIAAVAILLGSFLLLMFTRDPQKTTKIKSVRNRAILYGLVLVPALGLIIAGIGTITGNPVLEGMSF